MDSAEDSAGMMSITPLTIGVAESASSVFSHWTFPLLVDAAHPLPVAISMLVLLKNCTKAIKTITIKNSTVKKSENGPFKKPPPTVWLTKTANSGRGVTLNVIPTIAITIIPMNMAPVTFPAYKKNVNMM